MESEASIILSVEHGPIRKYTFVWSKSVQFIRPVKPGQTKVKFGRYFDPNLTYFIKTASKFDQSEKPIF